MHITVQTAYKQILTSRNLIIREFISHQVHDEPLVLNITIPVPIRTSVKAHSCILPNFNTGGKAGILRVNAVVGLQVL